MHAELIMAETPGALERAAVILRNGGLVAFPTDTVYGVAAHAFRPAAIARLYEAKGRPSAKAIAVLVADVDQVHQVVREVPAVALRVFERYWPGALTVVLPRGAGVPDVLSGGRETIAVRMPDHPLALGLIAATGSPLAVTSANVSGNPDPVSAQDVARDLGDAIDLIVDGGVCPGGIPSTVLDLTVDTPVVLRAGPISTDDLNRFLSAHR